MYHINPLVGQNNAYITNTTIPADAAAAIRGTTKPCWISESLCPITGIITVSSSSFIKFIFLEASSPWIIRIGIAAGNKT